ncbi:thioesterase [Actinokineospora diospyrosa]|uniref:Acyl-CoA thioesterase FadM n=1 Tax=Actinokineospora diospyrosa TaxID=103728 RepID=A0ABT1I9T4_9PSEU|nr:thioesterase [Actinokineospora diospyrosa]MCP2269398.1 Acyl-CoA thioesterase FadM [Actinokineospora diospyrosa]
MTTGVQTPTSTVGRPRYEGANIRTWIGFKHFGYLLEEAVLDHFRGLGLGPAALFHRHGVGLEFVETSIQLPATLDVDDVVTTVLTPVDGVGPALRFTAKMTVDRGGRTETVLTGRIAVVLTSAGVAGDPLPMGLDRHLVSAVDSLGKQEGVAELPLSDNAFLWSWRIPYYDCHLSDRLQHGGYIKAVEEGIDRFLADRGISIRTMLDTRGWIPVVSRSRIKVFAAAYMEETVHTVLTVRDIVRDVLYTADLDFYVRRGDRLIRTATATILHGYAISRGERAGALAEFDAVTRAALLGGSR